MFTQYNNFEAGLAELLDCDNPPVVTRGSDSYGPWAHLRYDDGSEGELYITSGGSVGFWTGGNDEPCFPGN
jgi:hypothetical protein